jgi:type III pantothenate kinase
MKLVIDIGNTLSKVAVFDRTDIVELHTTKNISVEYFQNLLANLQDIQASIIAHVAVIDVQIINYLASDLNLIVLSEKTPLPFVNKYETPSSLGYDRIAAVAAAAGIFPNKNVLVIDAGSCITYDFISSRKEYMGGGISPGIKMRFSALNTFTGKLPLISSEPEKRMELIGTTTEKSILSGIQNGVLHEVDGIIDAYKMRFPDIKIVISGGDYKYFDKYLKNNIFASPNIVLAGLNRILDFNENY